MPPAEVTPAQRGTQFVPGAILKWAGVIALSAGTAAGAMWQYQRRNPFPTTGVLTVQTVPPGVEVLIGGQAAGRTPLSLTLASGSHDVQVGGEGQRRSLKVELAAGSAVAHHFEFGRIATPPASAGGALQVETDPGRQMVVVDGTERGLSPLIVERLSVGEHEVLVRGPRGATRRKVLIKPQETVSLVISAVEFPVSLPGWLAVSSPVSMQLREDGRLIGTTDTDRLMLPSGEHQIEILNEDLGYRSIRKVTVAAGKTTATRIELPSGILNINAQPWAEVWVDGDRVGETPIANLSRAIGSHEVLLRHPQLGDRREKVVVTVDRTARLGVDMRGK